MLQTCNESDANTITVVFPLQRAYIFEIVGTVKYTYFKCCILGGMTSCMENFYPVIVFTTTFS